MSLLNLLTQEQCPHCHSRISADLSHCPVCGIENARKWRLCPHCSISIPADAHHCWHCNAQVPEAPLAATFSQRWQRWRRHPELFALREIFTSPVERWSSGLWVDADVAAALIKDGQLHCELAPGYHSASVFPAQATAGSVEAVLVSRSPVPLHLRQDLSHLPLRDGPPVAVEFEVRLQVLLEDLPLFIQHELPAGTTALTPENLRTLVSRLMERTLWEICSQTNMRMLAAVSQNPAPFRKHCLERLNHHLAQSGLHCDRVEFWNFQPLTDPALTQDLRPDRNRIKDLEAELKSSKLLMQEMILSIQHGHNADPVIREQLGKIQHELSFFAREAARGADEDNADLEQLSQLRKMQCASMEKLRALKQAITTAATTAGITAGDQEAPTVPAPAPQPTAGEPPPDSTHFTASMPRSVSAEEPFEVVVWMHLAQQLESVKSLAASHHGEASPTLKTKAGVQVRRGSSLTVSLKVDVPGVQVHPAQEELLWQGEITNACFTVLLGAAAPKGTVTAHCSIHCQGFKIAGLSFVISVEGKAVQDPGFFEIRRYAKAFASYASEDRDAVLARIQGMQKMRPDVDVFLDVARLRSNQDWKARLQEAITQADVLYLFWSAAAARSHWVDWEWRFAWQQKGDPGVDPVPLVSPSVVGPPQELSSKHFNEWMLAYMSGGKPPPPEA